MREYKIENQLVLFLERWSFSDLPQEFVEQKEILSLWLLARSTITEGWTCPMGVLTREFLENLELEEIAKLAEFLQKNSSLVQ